MPLFHSLRGYRLKTRQKKEVSFQFRVLPLCRRRYRPESRRRCHLLLVHRLQPLRRRYRRPAPAVRPLFNTASSRPRLLASLRRRQLRRISSPTTGRRPRLNRCSSPETDLRRPYLRGSRSPAGPPPSGRRKSSLRRRRQRTA